MTKREKERAWKQFLKTDGSRLVLSDATLDIVRQAFIAGYEEGKHVGWIEGYSGE